MKKYSIIIIIAAIIASLFFGYNFGHDTGHDTGYDTGYNDAVRSFESQKEVADHMAQQHINEYKTLCATYVSTVNSFLESMANGADAYDVQTVSEMREEFDTLLRKAGDKYFEIHQGVVKNDPDYACITADQFNEMNLVWENSAPEFYIEIDPGTRFGDDSSDIYYAENEVGVNAWHNQKVLWTINLNYHDQGLLYSPDTGEGVYYTHYLYTISDTSQPAVLFIRNYDFNDIDYRIVVINS